MSVTALILDDSSTVRQFLWKEILAILPDSRLFECESALDAGRLMIKGIPDILFVDLNMPGVSGMKFLEKLEAILLGRKPPVIVSISSDMSEATLQALKKLGAYDILPKPFETARLARVLLHALHLVRPRNVLIVDDSATNRLVIRRVMAKSRFNIRPMEANDGIMAVGMAQFDQYDAVFMDLNMPGIDGLEASGDIIYTRPDTNIVMMSTGGNEQSERAAAHIGVKYFLKKPFYASDVDAVLHMLFGLRDTMFVEGSQQKEFEDPTEAGVAALA